MKKAQPGIKIPDSVDIGIQLNSLRQQVQRFFDLYLVDLRVMEGRFLEKEKELRLMIDRALVFINRLEVSVQSIRKKKWWQFWKREEDDD